jgi:hypothetical protein
MSINSLGQYTAGHKVWDHVGNIIPDVEHSEGERPAIEFKPAAWLPVVFKDKYYEDWNVIMPGKIVALDNDGNVAPAQYGLASATITYTANDVTAGVLDVRTGVTLLIGAIGTFNVSAVTAFMGRTGVTMAVSKPIGISPYAVLRWAGGDGSNPANFIEHNYQRQAQIAVLCDYVISVPLIPASQSAAALTFGAASANVATASAVANLPVATNTSRTPIVFTSTDAGLFTNQVTALTSILSPGDWFINQTTGVVSVYETTGLTPSVNIAYYHYAAAASTVSVFASATGNLQPGDMVKCDANSNFVVAASTVNFQDVIGQVLQRDAGYTKDALDRVRTAYNPAIGTDGSGGLPGSLGQLDQMPGSATGGMPAAISYAGAADTLVRINLISR